MPAPYCGCQDTPSSRHCAPCARLLGLVYPTNGLQRAHEIPGKDRAPFLAFSGERRIIGHSPVAIVSLTTALWLTASDKNPVLSFLPANGPKDFGPRRHGNVPSDGQTGGVRRWGKEEMVGRYWQRVIPIWTNEVWLIGAEVSSLLVVKHSGGSGEHLLDCRLREGRAQSHCMTWPM